MSFFEASKTSTYIDLSDSEIAFPIPLEPTIITALVIIILTILFDNYISPSLIKNKKIIVLDSSKQLALWFFDRP